MEGATRDGRYSWRKYKGIEEGFCKNKSNGRSQFYQSGTKDTEHVAISCRVFPYYKVPIILVHVNQNNLEIYDFGNASSGDFVDFL